MLTLENIEDRQTREKIKAIQSVLPWASVMLCKNALLESKGTVNGACFILTETVIDLSDNEDSAQKREDGPHSISESSSAPSYELIQDRVSGQFEVLRQPGGSTCDSRAEVGGMVEILLPGNIMLGDLRETAPGVFNVRVDTKFSGIDKHGVRTSLAGFSDSLYDHHGDLHAEGKHSEGKQKRAGTRKANALSVLKSSRSKKHDVFGDIAVESPIMGDAAVRTTRSMIRRCIPTIHEASRGFPWGVEPDSHPFYRDEHSAEDKKRLASTAAAVIRAACVIEPKQSFTRKGHEMWIVPFRDAQSRPFKTFTMSHGLFEKWQGSKPINDGTYIGTNRGRFMPSSWIDAQDSNKQGFLQVINVQGQYKNCSFEELRLGDYLRDRTKAPHLFSLFHKLPAELRLMVWKFALTPRVVELRYCPSLTTCWTPCATPALLHVCREARIEALKSYELSFGLPGSPPTIYFAASFDTLFLTFEKGPNGEWDSMIYVDDIIDRLEGHNSKGLQEVQNLAIDECLWDYWNDIWADQILEYLQFADDEDDEDSRPKLAGLPAFTKLKNLKIVQNSVEGFWKQPSGPDHELDEDDFETGDVEFLPLTREEFQRGEHGFCECTLKSVKNQCPEWSMPTLGFLKKVERDDDED